MAPAVTETVAQVTQNLKQKLSLKDQVQPNLETGHREPLKLSGALDQFKQFEVTPVIGKEFVDVDLAEWLRAPNSDELLRDLAITGTATSSSLIFSPKVSLTCFKYLKEVLYSFASKTTSQTTSKRNSYSALASSPESQRPLACIFTPLTTPAGNIV